MTRAVAIVEAARIDALADVKRSLRLHALQDVLPAFVDRQRLVRTPSSLSDLAARQAAKSKSG